MLWEGMIWKEQSERCVMEKEARNPLGSQKVYFLRIQRISLIRCHSTTRIYNCQ